MAEPVHLGGWYGFHGVQGAGAAVTQLGASLAAFLHEAVDVFLGVGFQGGFDVVEDVVQHVGLVGGLGLGGGLRGGEALSSWVAACYA